MNKDQFKEHLLTNGFKEITTYVYKKTNFNVTFMCTINKNGKDARFDILIKINGQEIFLEKDKNVHLECLNDANYVFEKQCNIIKSQLKNIESSLNNLIGIQSIN